MNQSQEQNNLDGFQSEIEQDKQELTPVQKFNQRNEKFSENQASLLPPGRAIINDNYSLYPDIITGWMGPEKYSHPIPITVEGPYFDTFFAYLSQSQSTTNKICYYGPRYDNTFFAWHKMPFQFPYSHLQPPTGMKFTNRPFVGQNEDFKDQHIIFDSFFESGNLDCAVHVGENEYDLFLRVDTNTRGHYQWYNFTVSNMKVHKKYRINICNLQKDYSLYSRGMKPYILSSKAKEKAGKDWEQSGQNVKYEKKICKSMANYERYKYFYQLSFDISTKYQNDTLQIAYCASYTYTNLTKFLQDLKKRTIGGRFYSEGKLCKSLGGIPIPMITITQELNEEVDSAQRKLKKKCIILAGRVHPGESNSSFVMEGFLNFLCSNSKLAKYLRSNILFKIIPMLNPDGVSLGNYRTGLSGKDFNRQYLKPDPSIFPEISNLKKLVSDYKKKFSSNFLMFIDFHGHATKKNAFMYGPEYTLAQRSYYEARMLPRILSKQTKMFRYYSCIFKIQQEKKGTARAVFLNNLGVSLSYTLEISNFSYYDTDQLKNYLFDIFNWTQMGVELAHGMHQYLGLVRTLEMNRAQKFKKRQLQKMKENEKYLKKMKGTEKQRKKSTKKASSNNLNFKFGKVESMGNQDDDEDLMNYIYKEIEMAEKEKKQFQEKNRKETEIEQSQSHTDSENKEDDLDEEQLKLLYQCIKKRRKSDVFQSIIFPEQMDSQNKKIQKSNFESLQSNKPKHRRVQSVKIYTRSDRKKSVNVKEPTRIMIGTQVQNGQNRVFRTPNQSRTLYSYRQLRDKPKTFQEFIATQRTFEKQVKKSVQCNKFGRVGAQKKEENQINEFGSEFLSPNKNSSPDREKMKLGTFQQNKMEIYKKEQKRREKQKLIAERYNSRDRLIPKKTHNLSFHE